jgi:ATP-binding cassette subfamily B (MDR/TAP) protein 1
MAGVSKREQMRYGVAGGIASEVLTSIKTVVAFGGEHFEIKRLATLPN